MAERRMFAKAVIGSGRFLKMPPSSRLLYYDLGMYADDDGVVEAFTVMRQTGATDDDLRVLVSKGFVKILTDELVAYITDWHSNNIIRSDRYHKSQYQSLLVKLDDNQLTTNWQPSDNQMETEVRLGKVRIGKDSLGEDSISDTTPSRKPEPKQAYGQYGWIKLTENEYNKLKDDFGDKLDKQIARIDEYIQSNGNKNKYKDWNLVIRKSFRDNWFGGNNGKRSEPDKPSRPKVIGGELVI